MKTNKGFAWIPILLISLGIVLVGGIAYKIGKNNSNYYLSVAQNQNSQKTTNALQNSTITYNNQKYNFTFNYPNNSTLSDDQNKISSKSAYMFFYSGTPIALVDIEMPNNLYPVTSDFGGASFTVFINSDISQKDCTKIARSDFAFNGSDTTVKINTLDFTYNSRAGEATGTGTFSSFYTIYHNNLCYGLMESVGINGGVYSGPENITAHINYKDFLSKLDIILNSFQFTK